VSREELIPPDHAYRHLGRTLDLGFVRDLVRDTYAGAGRPANDPVVVFTLPLILFVAGRRPEGRLLRLVANRRSLRGLPQRRADGGAPRPLPSAPPPGALGTRHFPERL
jgi:hypothetical protein